MQKVTLAEGQEYEIVTATSKIIVHTDGSVEVTSKDE